MTTRRNQVNSASFINLDTMGSIGPTIQLNESFTETLPDGKSISFNPGVLCFGSVSYSICKDSLSSNAQVYYKSTQSNTLYENEYALFDEYPNEGIYRCVLSRGIPPEQNTYIFEYSFHAVLGTGGRMLLRTPLWLKMQSFEIEVIVESAVKLNKFVVKLNPSMSDLDPPVGIFLKSGSYDSVRTTLAEYYDYRCDFNDCFVLDDPPQEWINCLSPVNIIDGKAIVCYWGKTISKNDSSEFVSAMVKHDRSSSHSMYTLMQTEPLKSLDYLENLKIDELRTLSTLD